MKTETMELIYTLKRANKPWRMALAEYMHKLTGSPKDTYYSDHIVYDVIKDAFLDYIKTCDSPANLMHMYLYQCEQHGTLSASDHLATALMLEQVMDLEHDRYVNGFKPMKGLTDTSDT